VSAGGAHDDGTNAWSRIMRDFRHRKLGGVLTKPLKEQDKLLQRYCRTRSREVRDRLLEHYLPLVYTIARRVVMAHYRAADVGDLVGVGSLALFESLTRFDPRRGVPFSIFAAPRIRGAILDDFRKQNHGRHGGRWRKNEPDAPGVPVGSETENDRSGVDGWEARRSSYRAFESLDLLVDPKGSGSIDDFERREMVAHLTTTLSARERNILNLYYGRGITMREISKRMGLSVPRISSLHSSILGRLQSRFKELQHEVFS
jgi:RNA polymerase sigma factor FliA